MKWDDLLPGQRHVVVEKLRTALMAARQELPKANEYWPNSRRPQVVGSDISALEAAIEILEGRA